MIMPNIFSIPSTAAESNTLLLPSQVKNLKEPYTVLLGGEGLGYTNLQFAHNSSILVSCSNIPVVELRVWNWVDSIPLCSVVLDSPLTCLSVNPSNWRHICGSNENGLTFWTVAKVSHLHCPLQFISSWYTYYIAGMLKLIFVAVCHFLMLMGLCVSL